MHVTTAGLYAVAPGASPEIVDGIVRHHALLAEYGIDTPQRLAHFLGQCACETSGFTRLEENLYYTTPERLMAVWPARFRAVADASPYLRNPQALANHVYSRRLGNGPPESDEGWKYRGSGCKQTTGKDNYRAVERDTGLPVVAQPELLRRFPEALQSACIYWRDNRLNRFADAGDIVALTRAVQGADGGLADRRIYTDRAKRWTWAPADAHRPPPAQPEPEQPAEPLLRNGSAGTAVAEARELLIRNGYRDAASAAPQRFDDGLDAAVRAFQQDRQMMIDGVIGPATWAALRGPLEAERGIPPEPAARDAGGRISSILGGLFGRRGDGGARQPPATERHHR